MGNTQAIATIAVADAVVLVESTLREHRPPSPRAIDALRASEMPVDPADWTVDDRVIAAARILAHARLGQVRAAAALADRWRDVPLPPPGDDASATAVLGLGSAVVEAKILHAEISAALPLAERLLANALDVGDDLWTLRCRGLLAAASALHRDHDLADRQQREMRALLDRRGWDAQVSDYMGDLGEAALALTALDAARLRQVSRRLHRMLELDAFARPLCHLVDAAIAMLDGDHHRMTALTSRLVQNGDATSGDDLFRRCALQLQAVTLIRRDEPMRALGLLRQESAPEEHLWCPHLLRAAAHLRAGDPRSALGATTECVRIRPRHNLHTLSSVMLLRGLAHLRLQMTELGRREIGEALALLDGTAPAATFSLLHAVDRRMLIASPELQGVAASAALSALQSTEEPTVSSPPFPVLTPRERAVAEQLRLPRSFPEIAADMHVAPSTVKTQALSIYKKLRVSARADAVGLLEQAGYFEL